MTNLLIIRHGYSESNEKDLFVGHGNVDLTERGRLQAQLTANYLKSIKIDVIYSSDLDRAVQTAEPTSKSKNLPIITSKNLREIYAGEWEFVSYEEIGKKYSEAWSLWSNDIYNAYCTGGETILELQDRIYKELERLCKINDGKTVLAVSHGSSIRSFVSKVLNLTPAQATELKFPPNASVSTFTYENGTFSMVEYGKDDFMGDLSTRLVI